MQGSDATTIGDIPFDRGGGSGGSSRPAFLGAFVAAAVGCIAAYSLHAHYAAAPVVPPPKAAAAAPEDPAKPFGDIIVEPEWREAIAQKPEPAVTLASLNPETPAEVPAPVPPPPPAAAPPVATNLLPDVVPLPPVRDVPRIDDTAPLPPARPAEFAEPTVLPVAPDRRVAQPTAPADDRNIIQKLLGLGQPGAQQPGVIVASRPPAEPVGAAARRHARAAAPPLRPPRPRSRRSPSQPATAGAAASPRCSAASRRLRRRIWTGSATTGRRRFT